MTASSQYDDMVNDQSLFRMVFNHAATGICLLDLDGRFLRVNHAFCQMLGYSEEQLLQMNFHDISVDEDIPTIERMLARMVASTEEESYQFEKRCICQNDDLLWTHNSVALLRDDANTPLYFVDVVQNITKRKKAEERLRFQAQLLDNVRESVIATDLDGIITYWGKGAENLYGHAVEEAIGRPVTFIVDAADQAAEEERMQHVKDHGFWEGEYRQRKRDGTAFWAETRITLIYGEAGEPIGLIGTDRDITERRVSEMLLKKSEERFRHLMQESPIAIQIFAPDGVMVDVNKSWEQIWGASAKQAVGHFNPLKTSVFHELGVMPLIERAFAGEQVIFPEYEYDPQHFGLSGEKVWVRMRAYPIFDENDQLSNVVVMSEDITERKNTAVNLHQTSERLAALREIDQEILAAQSAEEIARVALVRIRQLVPCQRASLVMFDFENGTGHMLASSADEAHDFPFNAPMPLSNFGTISRLKEGEVSETPDYSMITGDSKLLQRLYEIGIRSSVSIPLVTQNQLLGALFLGRNTQDAFTDKQIEIGKEVATQLAISIQQSRLFEAERKRRQEAETLRTVTSAIATTLDLDQVMTLILEQLRLVIAYDSASVFLWEEGHFRVVAVSGVPDEEQMVDKVFPDNDVLSLELREKQEPILIEDAQRDPRFQKWGGTDYVRGWMGVPLIARGKVIGHLTVDSRQPEAYGTADVQLIRPFANQAAQAINNAQLYDQVQHHAEELESTIATLKETQHRLVLQERLAAVGQLAAGIAHDFNNILAVIVLYAQLLQRTANVSKVNMQRLETIVEQGNRATYLIQQILDFSRQSMIEKRPLVLNSYLKELGKLLVRTLPETIAIQFDIPDDHTFPVSVDATSLQQLVMNLAVNARDAMPEGGTLHIRLTSLHNDVPLPTNAIVDLPPGHWVVMYVSDTGVGIAPEIRERVFEPFFTTKPTGQGTGLGLAQAYGIVKQHDGFIFCESEPGQGTTFSIYLPLINGRGNQPAPSKVGMPAGGGQKILLVEDSELTRQALLDILDVLNYEVIVAANGVEATAVLTARSDIDLVLSDVVMPEMGGLALHEWMQTHCPHVKLLLMTGYAVDKNNKLASGAIPWIKKPFTVDRLGDVLHKLFDPNTAVT